ncbi:MAG: AsmA family protein, partial [Calditrichia bacterium]|nr:AsmA family protein [Calditrichia bacterium]
MSKIHKVLFWFVSISLSFIILAIGLFYLLRNDILFYVIQSINKSQPGEIVAEQIHLSPFYQFPYITLRLENISYFEKPGAKRKNNDLPICNIQSFYLSLDIIELVSGNLNVRNLTLEDGQVDLIAYEDGSTNINNALGASEDEPDSIEKMSDLNEKIEIEFEQVELKNLKISLENKFSGNRFQIVIDQLTIAFKYSGGSIFCNLISSFKIGEVQAKGYDFLSDKNIKSDLEFMFDLDSLILSLDSSQVIIDNGKLGVHGLVDLKNDGFVNLEVTAEETDLSLLSLFVEEEALRLNIKNEGTLVVNGRIRGKLLNHLPQLDLSFSGDKIDLAIPGTNKQVKSLGFSGKFFTGNSPDLSTAVLRLTKFEALVPGGQISGSLNIDNFVQPRIKLNLIGEADITGFHRLFKWDLFNSLGGEVLIDGDLNWIVDLKEQRLISRLGELRVKFKDVQCHLDDPEIKVDTLNGQ